MENNFVASHPYIKVIREINSIQQKNVEYERRMYLYEDKLATKHHQFPIERVFDISFREMSGGDAMLYIHTSQGVFSYSVKEDPTEFIRIFKEKEQERQDKLK
ncbi:hypothetical protein CR203_20075 [Salipaludibacillus neizhouensis]|uniref:Bacterial Pleckstrin homology domain-containing protein n=1 Tax=Salipaludibacillus neizhouensis TaxID=885475 RepID=A0A3A9K2Z3_9BACI|nr:hypothetical protein [Salipaludibacillus neizhouensis]RKL65618.1 hypothetical protein CR203_20075 [Salipaludibacillus neizhouensis]